MLELLSDVGVESPGDMEGETWYLGRVIGMREKLGSKWYYRVRPVRMDAAPDTLQLKCEWYRRAPATSGNENRLQFYFGDHDTNKSLSAPLDVAWYDANAVCLGLALPTFDLETRAYTLSAEAAKDFDDAAETSSSAASVLIKTKKKSSSGAVMLSTALGSMHRVAMIARPEPPQNALLRQHLQTRRLLVNGSPRLAQNRPSARANPSIGTAVNVTDSDALWGEMGAQNQNKQPPKIDPLKPFRSVFPLDWSYPPRLVRCQLFLFSTFMNTSFETMNTFHSS
eukprot:m.328108 g.328108  ORF g.328108 m.328108 type:complete len:282 (+) comp16500_c0_seq6:301-1146(+)